MVIWSIPRRSLRQPKDVENSKASGSFLGFLSVQQRTRKLHIEELDQRPHEKGSNERSNTRKQTAEGAYDNADQVTANPAETEGLSALVGNNDRNRVIDRNPQIGCHIQGGSEAHHYYSDHKEQYTDHHRRRRRQALDGGL